MLAELLAFFRGEFPKGHPYGRVKAIPGLGAMPKIWLLGSSTYSAQVAGALGLPFGHAGTSRPRTVSRLSRPIVNRSDHPRH